MQPTKYIIHILSNKFPIYTIIVIFIFSHIMHFRSHNRRREYKINWLRRKHVLYARITRTDFILYRIHLSSANQILSFKESTLQGIIIIYYFKISVAPFEGTSVGSVSWTPSLESNAYNGTTNNTLVLIAKDENGLSTVILVRIKMCYCLNEGSCLYDEIISGDENYQVTFRL